MSAQPQTLTKCSRDGCESMTAGTFCGRECNRLAHCGPGTRAHPRAGVTRQVAPMAEGADATTHVSRAEWLHVRHYFSGGDASKDSSGARRVANIRKRRQQREALAKRRRDAAKQRRSR